LLIFDEVAVRKYVGSFLWLTVYIKQYRFIDSTLCLEKCH